MNSLVAALVAFATVSAAPFVFDHHLVRDGSPKLAVFHHVGHHLGTGANAARLRFVHLVPKAHHLSEFSDGLASQHGGSPVKLHDFLKLTGDEKLVELLGLSNCRTWHASVLGFWNPKVGHLVHKVHGGVKGEGVKVLGGLDELVDFVHVHFDADHYKVFGHLLRLGLTSHLFTHKLHAKLEHGLNVHTT